MFAVVLAAGRASRFGDVKLLAEWRGRPLIRHVIDSVERVCGVRSVLVTGHAGTQVHAAAAPLAGFLVHNDDYDAGIGRSVATGVAAVAAVADGILLVLGDQPRVDSAHLARLAACWRDAPDRPVATGYAGTAGVPAVFPPALFPALCRLQGDRGAQGILAQCPDCRVIDCDAAAADIDRPADLAALARDCP
ncbi:MAG: nucleotidyltransferase family protein [Woeseiaceae bacterium]|nr:nucleotidyltransferase family protein [Woeseiaceae bacterium]